jgi:hypothetical protein
MALASSSRLANVDVRVPPASPRRAARAHAPRARAVVAMAGPPMPSRALGHVIQGDAASVVRLEFWLDYACPFSGRFWRHVRSGAAKYGDKVQLVCYHQVQPWHFQSTLAHEVALAFCRVKGEEAFVSFSDALFDADTQSSCMTDVEVENKTKMDIYDSLIEVGRKAGGSLRVTDEDEVKVREILGLDAAALKRGEKNPGNLVTQELKFYIKLGRQTGVHVSPSTYLHGLAVDSSSSWRDDEWHEFFDRHLAAAAAN